MTANDGMWIPIPLTADETNTREKRVAAIATILRTVWREEPDAQSKVNEIRRAVTEQILGRGWSPIFEDLRAGLERDLGLPDEKTAIAKSEEGIWERARLGLSIEPPEPGAFRVSHFEFRLGVEAFLGLPKQHTWTNGAPR